MTITTRSVPGGIQVTAVPAGTKRIHVAYNPAKDGPGAIYDPSGKMMTWIDQMVIPSWGTGHAWIDAQPFDEHGHALGGWAGRKDPLPVPPPAPAPVPSTTTPSGLVISVDTGGWPGSLHDELTKAGIIYRRINNPSLIREIETKGGRVASLSWHNAGWGSSQGPLLYSAAAYGAEIGKLAGEHPGVLSWEVLNEPEGAQNPNAADKIARYVAMLKASRESFAAVGAKAKLIASWAPTYGFGKAWAAAGGLEYVDGVVVHAYGGAQGQHKGLLGARELIEQAHAESGKPVYVTEVGWPTALGRGATGDSQQWTEAQQAHAITDFASWAHGQAYIPLVTFFNAVDYGTNNWYGVEREDRTHKPSFNALASVATK